MTSLIDDAPEGVNTPEFSVSELSGAVKRMVEGEFGHVRVRGEVGRVSRPRSGHLYLDLKDDRSVLAGVVWKGVSARLQTQPEEGMEVIATGRLTTFPGQSKYQIVIEEIAPAGVGALMAMLEKRRKALAAEGLFDESRKRALPFLPRTIGVVTSPSGAVIQDILHRVAERFPVHVLIWPVAVQGAKCARDVAAAINGFSAMQGQLRPDTVIVARGGGSVEDLWGFNEEIVVRAAAECSIPLISAVGHETDTTLIDFAADLRAPTPSAAAERAVPVRAELAAMIADLQARRLRALEQGLDRRRQRLSDLVRALPRPDQILGERRQRLDALTTRLPRMTELTERARNGLQRMADRLPAALRGHIARARLDLAKGASPLTPRLLQGRVQASRDRLERPADRLVPLLRERVQDGRMKLARPAARFGPKLLQDPLQRNRDRTAALSRLLDSLGYRQTLSRGYAVVRRSDGPVLARAAAISEREEIEIEIEFADDTVKAMTGGKPRTDDDAAPAGQSARTPRAAKKPDPGQGSLF